MRTDNWRPVTPKEPPLYEPVILCRIRDGKLVSEAGTRERDGWWKVYGTRVKKILCWQPMPTPPDLTEWDEWMEAQKQERGGLHRRRRGRRHRRR